MPSSDYLPFCSPAPRTRTERLYGRGRIEDCNIPGEPSEVIKQLQKKWKYWARKYDEVHEELEDCEGREQAAVAKEEAVIAYCRNNHSCPMADQLEKSTRAEIRVLKDQLIDMTRAKCTWYDLYWRGRDDLHWRDRHQKRKQDIAEATVGVLQAQLESERDQSGKLKLGLHDTQKISELCINNIEEKSRENRELKRLLELAAKCGQDLLEWKIAAEKREFSRGQMLVSLSPAAKPGDTTDSGGTAARDWSTKPDSASDSAGAGVLDDTTSPD
ncbi:hypothetical protein FB567DRAFT_599635 [Paraphoma chrysanthemicola]|uniref:Uncharacterized protein n=1 Tax=Paraphoma chrysanthemicola TaxID=798071 RepID=A0A8K0QRL7_9PLEO|nr:hypothetical protein FB567DRAFT_599635 [Paraphoma chrysanthemicola]